MTIENYLTEKGRYIDKALDKYLPPKDKYPPRLHEAMRYTVFSGGKRIRPIILLAVAEALGEKPVRLMKAACAMEIIHVSLIILDDLPSMDDATLRRGKPPLHLVFGEANAILAACALLLHSFTLLSQNGEEMDIGKEELSKAIISVSEAVGSSGVVAGEYLDLEVTENGTDDKETIEYINDRKTGALFIACCEVAAIFCKAKPKEFKALQDFGKKLGMAFQIGDDIIGMNKTPDESGKHSRKDANKPTYVGIFGLEKAKATMDNFIDEACRSLEVLGDKSDLLHELAEYVSSRER